MKFSESFPISNLKNLKQNILCWANQFDCFSYSDNNNYPSPYHSYEVILAAGVSREIKIFDTGNSFSELKKFYDCFPSWLFGFFSYDLKNEIENLTSKNPDYIKMPVLHFFQPQYLIICKNNLLIINSDVNNCLQTYKAIKSAGELMINHTAHKISIHNRISKKEYVENVNQIKDHIKRGDIYELNYCQEFYNENITLDPLQTYIHLNRVSPMPMSCYYRVDNKHLISSSPERFLKKIGLNLISQPIKGTIQRGKDHLEDIRLINELKHSEKERAENIMIVDLVRNDLSRTAKRSSIKIEELCGIYTFNNLHQMISTVTSEIEENIHFNDAIKNAFPMGSMTGAPKVRAMELIEEYETTGRGLFSGAIGYITPEQNFDFNVVIRSILYNARDKYLSCHAGSAITYNSNPQKEYKECLLKIDLIRKIIQGLN